MIFKIRRAMDNWKEKEDFKSIEITTLEQLKELSDSNNQEKLILDFKEQEIIIYDDYVEI